MWSVLLMYCIYLYGNVLYFLTWILLYISMYCNVLYIIFIWTILRILQLWYLPLVMWFTFHIMLLIKFCLRHNFIFPGRGGVWWPRCSTEDPILPAPLFVSFHLLHLLFYVIWHRNGSDVSDLLRRSHFQGLYSAPSGADQFPASFAYIQFRFCLGLLYGFRH